MVVHHVPSGGHAARLALVHLLHDAHLLPVVARQERLHRRHHRDVQRDPRPVPADVGPARLAGRFSSFRVALDTPRARSTSTTNPLKLGEADLRVISGDDRGWRLVPLDDTRRRGRAALLLLPVLNSAAFHVVVMVTILANGLITASISFKHDGRPRSDFYQQYYYIEVRSKSQFREPKSGAKSPITTALALVGPGLLYDALQPGGAVQDLVFGIQAVLFALHLQVRTVAGHRDDAAPSAQVLPVLPHLFPSASSFSPTILGLEVSFIDDILDSMFLTITLYSVTI